MHNAVIGYVNTVTVVFIRTPTMVIHRFLYCVILYIEWLLYLYYLHSIYKMLYTLLCHLHASYDCIFAICILYSYVTGFIKRGLIHTSNFHL